MSTGDIQAPRSQAVLTEMQRELSSVEQYRELLVGDDDDKRAARKKVGALLVTAAENELAITATGLDYGVESLLDHELSPEEYVYLLGDMKSHTPETEEAKAHQIYIACEMLALGRRNGGATPNSGDRLELRLERISGIADRIAEIEDYKGERIENVESALDLGEQLRGFLFAREEDSEAKWNYIFDADGNPVNSVNIFETTDWDDVEAFLDQLEVDGRIDYVAAYEAEQPGSLEITDRNSNDSGDSSLSHHHEEGRVDTYEGLEDEE